MKQTVFYLFMLASLTFICLSGGKDDFTCNVNTVRVFGDGQVQVEPDTAQIYAYITQDGQTVTLALTRVNLILVQVLASLNQTGVPAEDVSTSYISVYPKYDYSSGTGVITGYTVYLSLTITIRGINKDSTKLGAVIDGIVKAGVTSISGIYYSNSNPDVGTTLARKLAFADATNKAKQYAQLAGRKLNKIILIDETNQSSNPFYLSQSVESLRQANGNGPNLTLPSGTTTVSVRVIVVWCLY